MDDIKRANDGIFERMEKLAERMRFSPNYTKEIGTRLGIEPIDKGRDSIRLEWLAGQPDYRLFKPKKNLEPR